MTYQVRNIIVGAAALYISASDSSVYVNPPVFPVLVAGTAATVTLDADSTNWRHSGYTTDGLEVTYAPDYQDIVVDQLLDAAKIFKQAMKVTVGTTLSEVNLENLVIAWGQATSAFSSTGSDATLGIASGALGDSPIERALIAVGPAPKTPAGAKRERVYYARRVLSVESSAHGLKRNEATVFPVSFRLLPDPSQPAGYEYGQIRDRNTP
jgi:hypothetical protein